MGTVDFGGIRRKACLEYAPEVEVGHCVVIHVGFAISVVDEEEAARSYALLAEMDNLENIDLPQDPDGVRPEALGMRYLDEYRDDDVARALLRRHRADRTRPWTIMEVCGGQTHTLIRQGIDQVLPARGRARARPGLPGLRDAASR